LTVGRPGALPARSDQPAFRFVISNSLELKVLRRPLESAQYTSIRYSDRLADAGALASIGTVGDSYDRLLLHTAPPGAGWAGTRVSMRLPMRLISRGSPGAGGAKSRWF
jgi:hypothetical protein